MLEEPEEDDGLDAADTYLLDEVNLSRFVLWRRGAGMGGETMASILALSKEPGGAAMMADFATLAGRLRRLEWRKKQMKQWEKGKW